MDKPQTFNRIPTTIRAIQWTGENLHAVREFVGERGVRPSGEVGIEIYIAANKGWLVVLIGDWIAEDGLGFCPIANEHGHPLNYRAAQ